MALVKKLIETGINELDLVGGKNANLGEMIKNLSYLGINIPDGFVITSNAYDLFINYNDIANKIDAIINNTDIDNIQELCKNSKIIRNLFYDSNFPKYLEELILHSYNQMSLYSESTLTEVAVRSSGTNEDLPDASFAGQQDTYLNVKGHEELLDKIKACFASLYTDRAISYRKTMCVSNTSSKLAICIQKMARSDLGCSGVAFSLDPDTGFNKVIVINSSYGLGELVVSGQIKPDEFIVSKELGTIIDKKIGNKINKMVYSLTERTEIVPVAQEEQNKFSLSDDKILLLAKWVKNIEDYYSTLYNKWCPMDIEWAFDGQELYIIQARPETIHSKKNACELLEYKLKLDAMSKSPKVIVKGIAVGSMIGSGKVRKIHSLEQEFNKGDVLVSNYTDPTYEPFMKIASAIITDKGGRTSHAAIVSRELGVPAIVGCDNAMNTLNNGDEITIDCSQGETGLIYSGIYSYEIIKTVFDINVVSKERKTKIMLNIGNPESVFKYGNMPVSGVGLAREEFIISSAIGIHPLAIINYDTMPLPIQDEIKSKVRGYDNPIDFYVKRLSYSIARIACTFYPNPVIVRFSDFKSNEYRELLGGDIYEPNEENPMIGFRGCSRYYSEQFKPAFKLECDAINHVRKTLGFTNVIVMLPFCRTELECIKTLETMKEFGLERGEHGLEVYLMCEIPSNVILADKFCKYVDGFSIGSNDLTQLCLGIDRDAGTLSHIGNETNEAVLKMISKAIKVCKRNNVKIGICGQGPSDIPDFAQFLINKGIDSISVVPDSAYKLLSTM
jgi:pyruvate,water dikinase